MFRTYLIGVVIVFGLINVSAVQAQSYAYPATGSGCVVLTQNLSVGSSGSDVTQLQNFLLAQNYPGSGSWMVTGYFGRATRQAVLNFQSQRTIAGTGVVDARTRDAIADATCGQNFNIAPAPIENNSAIPFYNHVGEIICPMFINYGNCDGAYDSYWGANVAGLYPNSGAVGTPVIIYGSGFTQRGNTVHFGTSVIANLSSFDGRSLSFVVPSRLSGYGSQSMHIGTYFVSVTNERGSTSTARPFMLTSLQEITPTLATLGGGYFTPAPVASGTSTPSSIATTTPSTSSATSTAPSTATSTMLWGAFVDRGLTQTANFEAMVGRQMDMQAVFASWGENNGAFPMRYAPLIRDKGKTMILFWDPNDSDSTPNDATYSNDTIINGSWDNYIKSFARQIIQYGGPVILVPMEEMNGRWFPWNGTVNGNSAAKFITAWRRIHDLVVAEGVTNVKWGWAVNSGSVPDVAGNQINDYYPGDDYVDYVGVDGFNLNREWGWATFSEIFPAALAQLQAYGKPIYIFSMGSSTGPRKAEWIRDALGTQVYKYPIVGWVWFHQAEFRVDTDPESLIAFREVIPN